MVGRGGSDGTQRRVWRGEGGVAGSGGPGRVWGRGLSRVAGALFGRIAGVAFMGMTTLVERQREKVGGAAEVSQLHAGSGLVLGMGGRPGWAVWGAVWAGRARDEVDGVWPSRAVEMREGVAPERVLWVLSGVARVLSGWR